MLTRKEYSVSFDIVETNTGFDLLHTPERLHLNSLPVLANVGSNLADWQPSLISRQSTHNNMVRNNYHAYTALPEALKRFKYVKNQHFKTTLRIYCDSGS